MLSIYLRTLSSSLNFLKALIEQKYYIKLKIRIDKESLQSKNIVMASKLKWKNN